jgi:hypothetical protein
MAPKLASPLLHRVYFTVADKKSESGGGGGGGRGGTRPDPLHHHLKSPPPPAGSSEPSGQYGGGAATSLGQSGGATADGRGHGLAAPELRLLEPGHGSVKKEPVERVGSSEVAYGGSSCPPMLSGPHLMEHHYQHPHHQQQVHQQHLQHQQQHHHHKFDFYRSSTMDLVVQDEQHGVRGALSAHGYIPN